MSEAREMYRLALPLALQQAGHHLMGLVDSAMLGGWSDAALAGAGVGNSLYFGLTCIGLGTIMGMDSIVPQALGAGRHADARRAVGAGVRLAVLVGLVTTLVLFASPLLLVAADVDAEVIYEARAFTYMRSLGAVPFLISVALRTYLTGQSQTRPLLIAVVVGNIANAGLDLLLIFGLGLGSIGAALATTIVQTLMLGVYLAGLRGLERGQGPRPPSTRSDMMQIARYGAPVGGQLFAEVGIFGVATVLAAHIGKTAASGHTIALSIASLTFSFALGIASAASVRVGLAVGAGDLALARRRGLVAYRFGLVVMGSFAALFVTLPGVLARLFSNEVTVIAATIPLLQIAALFQLSDGAQAIGAGALRGLGENRGTFVGNMVGHYVVGLPTMFVLAFGIGLGAPGLWLGLTLGLTVTALYLLATFLRSTSRSLRGSAGGPP